jgi:hypothetical protein
MKRSLLHSYANQDSVSPHGPSFVGVDQDRRLRSFEHCGDDARTWSSAAARLDDMTCWRHPFLSSNMNSFLTLPYFATSLDPSLLITLIIAFRN